MNKNDFLRQYQSKEWYETSKRIKARDHNTCQICGCNDRPLSVHHLYYSEDGDILKTPDESLITLCDKCHESQKGYREEYLSFINSMRCCLTDFEIWAILNVISTEYSYCKPIEMCLLDPLKNLREDFDFSELDTISKWRRNVYGQFLKKQAAIEYLAKDYVDSKKYIEYWFYTTFSQKLSDFLDYTKESDPRLYKEIVKEVQERKARIEKLHKVHNRGK